MTDLEITKALALEINAAACVNEYRELEIANEQLKAQLAAAPQPKEPT